MKLEVGMYVRTDNGIIGNIYEQIGDMFIYKDSNREYITYGLLHNEIIKASHNIIDLIEVGDYVNGELIHYIERFKDGSTYLCFGEHGTFVDYQIKSIVTSQQFSAMEYRLGDK